MEIEPPINPFVRTLFVGLGRSRKHHSERPCLELKRIVLGKLPGVFFGCRLPHNRIRSKYSWAKHLQQPALDDPSRLVGNVDTDPSPIPPFRSLNGCSAPTEGV